MNIEKLIGRELIISIGGRNQIIHYCDSGGADKNTILFVHGLTPSGWTCFVPLFQELPDDFRIIAPNFSEFGRTETTDGSEFTVQYHAAVLQEFIRALRLHDLTVVGHFTGGETALLAMQSEKISPLVRRLVLINSSGLCRNVPAPVAGLPELLTRHKNPAVTAYALLRLTFADPGKITDEMIARGAAALSDPATIDFLATAAKQFKQPDPIEFQRELGNIAVPVLLLWGGKDIVTDSGDAFAFHRLLANSTVRILKECGHTPHLEAPAVTAGLLAGFSDNTTAGFDYDKTVVELESAPAVTAGAKTRRHSDATELLRRPKLTMSRLVDHWTVGTTVVFLFIKLLQMLKKFGMRAEENGWRAATGIFLRNEYSKFLLGTFRLRYYNAYMPPADGEEAKKQLIRKLSSFLCNQGSYYWAVEPGVMKLKRRRVFFIDVVEADYDEDGRIVRLIPFFDPRQQGFQALTPEMIERTMNRFVQEYNALRSRSDRVRPQELFLRMKFWAGRIKNIGVPARMELKMLLDRTMTATFIHFDFNCDESLRKRLRTPDLKKHKHPGWGLLNIFCRFTADLSETDLWFQYHHVPVDGMPMQEILEKLKQEWGTAGEISYPALTSQEARPEVIYCGDRIFRARLFVNFEPLLALRRELNRQYATRMEGAATVAGMIIWGMMQHEYFRDNKFLFPVDLTAPDDPSQERELSLVFIRPSKYWNEGRPLESFIRFQREFNRMICATRQGRSESYELLELYSMIHPIFYYTARYLMPAASADILGTMGLSILKNAEIFVSPLSDLQLKGFMAIGNLTVPTADGGTAGAVSICANREQIKYYIRAISDLSEKYRGFLGRNVSTAE
ncbi:MAG: alpha/beta hydrolase [Victivallaceae bacterium]|nr:alpha/beta hydrolase [Victivallaceae bacterium]